MNGYGWTRVTNDQVVSNSPAWLAAVILTDDGNGNADITLYDGESTDDPAILTVRASQNSTKSLTFTQPLKTERGLYVDVGSNVNEALIQLVWDKE
jgi:hypothetical protein